jgi:hypothetical protein
MSEELQALLAELALIPCAAVPLPRLEVPANHQCTYRLDLADGSRRKAIVASSPERAAIIEQALRHLRLPALPRLFGRRGRTLILEWIEGEPAGDEALTAAATLLGRVHALAPPGLTAEALLDPTAAAARLADRTRRLLAEGIIDAATADRLLALRPPPPAPACLLHCDLCPENLLMADGVLRIADNGSWSIGPPAYDLGRVLWRWPMRAEARARFFATYRRAGGVEVAPDALAFWTAVGAVGGTFYRRGGPIADAARRLRELVRSSAGWIAAAW